MLRFDSEADLKGLNLGAHCEIIREWNEETEFNFSGGLIINHGYYTRVVHEDHYGALYVATYRTGGEGDLKSLRIWASRGLDASGRRESYQYGDEYFRT